MLRYFFVFCLVFELLFSAGTVSAAQSKNLAETLKEQAQLYYREGRSQVESGNFDSALVNFQKVIVLAPNFVQAYNEAGIILTINGQIEQAIEMYLKAIKLAPDYPDSYSNLALLYEEKKDFSKAASCWKKRANLGGAQDPWSEVARRRIHVLAQDHSTLDISAQDVPQASRKVLDISAQDVSPTSRKVDEVEYQSVSSSTYKDVEFSPESLESSVRFNEREKVDLFKTGNNDKVNRADSKAYALDYLARARNFYDQGEYVGALRESSIAEYLDPANQEISAFVQEIRQAIIE